jgi:hypothetical protein
MSTNSNCHFIEVEPGEWYYLLEDSNAPKDAWDWREFATAYGPFADLAKAQQDLHEEHANPGGAWVLPYKADQKLDEVVRARIAEAITPDSRGVLPINPWIV